MLHNACKLPQPRLTGNDLPDDIWRLIASHISSEEPLHRFYRLISVNRTFFDVILDAKYSEVRWVRLSEKFMRGLQRLQNPIISSHVRRLYIRAWFIEYLLKREALIKPPPPYKVCRLFTSCVGQRSRKRLDSAKTRKNSTSNEPLPHLSSEEIIRLLINAVQGMKNVTELHFEWRDLPLNKDTRIFLTSTRKAFSSSLRKLVLQAQISKFKELLAIADYENLDDLDFHFDYSPTGCRKSADGQEQKEGTSEEDTDARDLIQTVLPFVSHRKARLRSLVITSFSSLDLSEFLSGLPSMPALRRFGVNISLNKSQLSNPSGLINILTTHSSSLLYVSIKSGLPANCEQYNKVHVQRQMKCDWVAIHNLLLSSPQCLAGLESLEIPCICPRATLPLVQRSSDTLTRLTLTGYYLSEEEVTEVINIFSHRAFELQHLHLEVNLLVSSLFHLLAMRLPNLYSLVLVYEQHITLDSLYDVGIYEERYRPPSIDVLSLSTLAFRAEHMIMGFLSARVPSIQMWKGFPKDATYGPPERYPWCSAKPAEARYAGSDLKISKFREISANSSYDNLDELQFRLEYLPS
ncbi:hypothetical protein NLJ89_g4322 [Agrocybe chaxingu]|uniref:F-box domain-containing protein n=1 Tax=Agrocybe chaxingu TaxID=84603 RepID=A0A9W8K2W8_9AGAR|nr:hypothetical protein NLJ89_g4322 [Agrocybe chaxingu]